MALAGGQIDQFSHKNKAQSIDRPRLGPDLWQSLRPIRSRPGPAPKHDRSGAEFRPPKPPMTHPQRRSEGPRGAPYPDHIPAPSRPRSRAAARSFPGASIRATSRAAPNTPPKERHRAHLKPDRLTTPARPILNRTQRGSQRLSNIIPGHAVTGP